MSHPLNPRAVLSGARRGLTLNLAIMLGATAGAANSASAADAVVTNEPAAVTLPPKADFQLFLLAGQSNMAGRGPLGPDAKTPIPNVYSLNKDGQWQPAVDPLHWDKAAAGVGPGRGFARALLAKQPGITIGLIPTACGGSPISTWVPGASWAQTQSKPYDDAIARAKRALQDGTLKGILWHQGEGDCNAKSAPLYAERLTALIARFRADLNAPDLPFVIGQLGNFDGKPRSEFWLAVDAAQQEVAKTVKNVSFITSEGTTSRDNLHFDTASQAIMGQRYAEGYLRLVTPAP